jgi:hypothetical protein
VVARMRICQSEEGIRGGADEDLPKRRGDPWRLG